MCDHIAYCERNELKAEIDRLRAELAEANAKSDDEMERVKACEHIADGDEGWEKVRNLCPSTAAVARLRDRSIEAVTELAEWKEQFRVMAILEQWKTAELAEAKASLTKYGDQGAFQALRDANARIAELEGGKAGWEVEGFIDRLTRRDDSNSERLVLEAISHLRGFSRDCDGLRARAERTEERIAELETERAKLSSFHDMLTKLSHALARAEKAEEKLVEAYAGANILVADVKRFRDRQLAAEARAERAEAALAVVQSKGGLKEKVALLASENGCLRAELSQIKRDLKDWQDSSEAYRHDAEKAAAHVAALCDLAVYSDSYGVPGSDFACCHFCRAGGAPNVVFKHDDSCPVGRAEATAQEWWDERREAEADCKRAEAERDALREFLEGFREAETRMPTPDHRVLDIIDAALAPPPTEREG